MEPDNAAPREAGVNLDFRRLLKWVMSWKYVIFPITILAVAFAFYSAKKEEPVFGAEARILMTSMEAQSEGLNLVLGDQSGPINMLRGIFESRDTRKMIGDRAGMDVEEVKKKLTVLPDSQTKQILIQSRKLSTEKNLELVKVAIDVLEARSAELQIGPAGKQADLIKETLDKREGELNKAEDELAKFSKTMVSGPDATSTMAQLRELELEYGAAQKALESAEQRVRASASGGVEIPSFLPGTEELKRTIIDRRLALVTLQQSLGPGNPQVVKAQRDLKVAEDTLNEEIQKYIRSVAQNVDPVTAELAGREAVLKWQVEEARKRANLAPDEAKNFARLTREVVSLTTVVGALRSQYETTKIQADTEKLTWTVLDQPYTRDDKENGAAGKVIKFFLAAFVGSVVLCAILDKIFGRKKAS